MNVGTLTIEMAANVARLQKDMDAARRSVDSAMVGIQRSVGAAKTALSGLGVGISFGLIVQGVRAIINGLDELNDAADATGSSVAKIGALEDAARRTGGSLEGVTSILIKFNAGLKEADGKNGVSLALKAIGLDAAELRKLDPADALHRTAVALAGFAEDGNRARIIQELFGKSVKEAAPFLKDLAEKGMANKDALQRQAEEAEKANKQFAEMSKNVLDIARDLSGPLVKAFNETVQKFKDGAKEGKGFFKTLRDEQLKLLGLDGKSDPTQRIDALKKMLESGVDSRGVDLTAERVERLKKALADLQATQKGVAADSVQTAAAQVLPSVADIVTLQAKQKAAEEAAKKAAEEAKKAAEEHAKAVERGVKAYDSLIEKAGGLSGDFAEKWRDLATAYAAGKVSLDGLVAAQAELLKQQPGIKAVLEAQAEQLKSAREMLDSIREETRLLGMSNTEREVAIAMRKLEAHGVKEGTEAYNEYAASIRRAIVDREATRKNVEQAEQVKRDWERVSEQIGQSLSDSLMKGGRSAWEYIKGLFRSEVLRPIIQAAVQPALGMFGLGSSGGAMASSGGASSFSSISSLSSAASLVQKGVAGITSMFATGPGSLMGSLGLQINSLGNAIGSQMVSDFGAGMYGGATQAGGSMGAGGIAGQAGAYGLGILAGHFVGRAVSGGYAAFGGSGNSTVNVGTTIGAIFGGPIGAAIGGAIGGVVNRAFGRKAPQVQEQGIAGTFGSGGFAGSRFADMVAKGGWFRSDKHWTDLVALDSGTQMALDSGFAGLKATIADFAETLGRPTQQIKDYTKSVRLVFGADQDANQKLIDSTFASMGEDMARAVLSGFQRQGETAMQTLERLASSLGTVNKAFGVLDRALINASLSGGELAEKVIAAFGGVENFTSATAAYFDAIYSESEKLTLAQTQLQKSFDALGLAVPESAAAYKALVEAQDITTSSGLATYSALVQLAPAFAQVRDALDEQAKAAEDAARAVRDAWADIGGAIADEIRRIRGVATGGAAGYAGVAAQFATATARARAGDQDAARSLPGLSQDLLEAAAGQARTTAEYAVIRGRVAGSLETTLATAASMFNSQAIVDELKALRAEVALLRSEAQATASHTNKTARILDRVTQQDSLVITDSATL